MMRMQETWCTVRPQMIPTGLEPWLSDLCQTNGMHHFYNGHRLQAPDEPIEKNTYF